MCHTLRDALRLTSDDVYLEQSYNILRGDDNSTKVCWAVGIKARLRGSHALETAITAIGSLPKSQLTSLLYEFPLWLRKPKVASEPTPNLLSIFTRLEPTPQLGSASGSFLSQILQLARRSDPKRYCNSNNEG